MNTQKQRNEYYKKYYAENRDRIRKRRKKAYIRDAEKLKLKRLLKEKTGIKTVKINNRRGHDIVLTPIYSELSNKVEIYLVMGHQTDEPSYFCLETPKQIEKLTNALAYALQQLTKLQQKP